MDAKTVGTVSDAIGLLNDNASRLEAIVLELISCLEKKGVSRGELIGQIRQRAAQLRQERQTVGADLRETFDHWIASHEKAEEQLTLYGDMSRLAQRLPRLSVVKPAREAPGAPSPKPDATL